MKSFNFFTYGIAFCLFVVYAAFECLTNFTAFHSSQPTKKTNFHPAIILITLLVLHLGGLPCRASNLEDKLFDLSVEELMEVEIITASGTKENLKEAPATMVVVTAEEIKQRGYTDVTEVLYDLPGFDVMLYNGTFYLTAYQRGYRTPYTNRTLFMINGIEDNVLWTNHAEINRQYPMSNIKKIEVMYGPASAVYGPNAFLGIINLITYDGSEVPKGEARINLNALGGSYNSKGIDMTVLGRPGEDIYFSVAGKFYKSEEPDLTDKFGFLKKEQFSNPKTWGPLLDFEHYNHKFGSYYDPTDDYGIIADLHFKDLKFGLIYWKRKEGYGPYYPADRAQNNTFWGFSNKQYYLEYEKNINKSIKSHTLALYRESRIFGLWAEAEPDWNPGMEDYSYISLTQWNSINNNWLFKQNFEISLRKNLMITTGLQYDRKELTKAYDIPGYWDTAIDSSAGGSQYGIGHSTDTTYKPPSGPLSEMPPYNLAYWDSLGGFVQGILDIDPFRFNAGLRYDHNSHFGGSINPRASAIYNFSKSLTFKLLYGEAYQEPSVNQLYGGWSGRKANPDMKPESARNIEFITMHQINRFSHEASFYYSHYSNVIKEESENSGNRDIYGIEYRAKSSFPNFIPGSSDITGYFNYTYTDVTSSFRYNHDLGAWEQGDTNLGDIAPHKFNIGVNVPAWSHWNINLRENFVGEREFYTRNPLRAEGKKLDSYFVLNGVLSYHYGQVDVSFKVLNLLNENYFIPGADKADSGDDFIKRSKGYYNSIVPEPGRSYWVNLNLHF
ncbi:MAG: TonB-dependent receptor [Nitrospinae bacterium]|nr:TonB-dependent receptor [Nitrospinota bacterium]